MVEGAEDFCLEVKPFRRGFYGELRIAERLHVDRGGNPVERGFDFAFGEFTLRSFTAKIGADDGEGAVEEAPFDIAKCNGKTRLCKYMSDAGAHCPGSDHGDRLNL